MPIARFMAGVDCLSFARPAARTFVVDSTTTSVALAATPKASPATDRTLSTLRCAASEIACFAFVVTLLTMRCPSHGNVFNNADEACRVPKNREHEAVADQWSDQIDPVRQFVAVRRGVREVLCELLPAHFDRRDETLGNTAISRVRNQ
ncbi:MAG: hypothetical protein WB752_13410, partial [Pseudolabrys sp.]